MRFKYYLRGLGLGIIFSVLILIASVRLAGGIMTDERVVERAKELGMTFAEEETEAETESESETEPESESGTADEPAGTTPESE